MHPLIRHSLIFAAGLLFTGCAGKVISTDDLSDQYSAKVISGTFKIREHTQLFIKNEEGESEYLASVLDAHWAEKFPFGLKGLVAKNVAISQDGRSIIYHHNAVLAPKISKASGLYRHEYPGGEKLILASGKFAIPATRYPKPLPSDILAIDRSGGLEAVSTDGKIFPLLLIASGALHLAAFEGNIPTITKVLAQDSDSMEDLNYWSMTPLELAIINGAEEAAILLIQQNVDKGKLHDMLTLATFYRRQSVVEALLKRGVPPTPAPSNGHSPLHALFEFPNQAVIYPPPPGSTESAIDVLRIYADHGADLRSRDSKGQTLLHLTLDRTVIQFLLEQGLLVEEIDHQGNTALHFLMTLNIDERNIEGWEKEMLPLLELVVPKMKNLDVQNHKGLSPLQIAVRQNHLRTARYLIAAGANERALFIYGGLGPEITGQTIGERIDFTEKSSWWKDAQH